MSEEFIKTMNINKNNNDSGEAINQKHYQKAEKQPIEIMQMYFDAKEFYGFCKGNSIKYILRSRFKGHELQDMEKAYQYLDWALKCLHGEKVNPMNKNNSEDKINADAESVLKYYMDCNSHIPKAMINWATGTGSGSNISLNDFKTVMKDVSIKDGSGNEYDVILKKKMDTNKKSIVNNLLMKDDSNSVDINKIRKINKPKVSLSVEARDKIFDLIIQEHKDLKSNESKGDAVLNNIKDTYRDKFRKILKEYGVPDTDIDE